MAISDVKEYTHLTEEEVEQLGRELDAIRARDRGVPQRRRRGVHQPDDQDAAPPRHRRPRRPARRHPVEEDPQARVVAGAALLGVAKILENMEIGHNVMHGQWDWMNDPEIHSSNWEWDTAQPAEQWKHSHNYIHHQFTNVLGHDNDIGYGILRMAREQKWHPYNLGQPVYNALLAALFQWGVALHDLDLERDPQGREGPEGDEAAAAPDRAQGPQPDPQGLRRLPGADRAGSGSRRSRPTRPPT